MKHQNIFFNNKKFKKNVPFFNENPWLQFEQNNMFPNYIEMANPNDLSIFSNVELEKKWVKPSQILKKSY